MRPTEAFRDALDRTGSAFGPEGVAAGCVYANPSALATIDEIQRGVNVVALKVAILRPFDAVLGDLPVGIGRIANLFPRVEIHTRNGVEGLATDDGIPKERTNPVDCGSNELLVGIWY
jgi:hypothetical protein